MANIRTCSIFKLISKFSVMVDQWAEGIRLSGRQNRIPLSLSVHYLPQYPLSPWTPSRAAQVKMGCSKTAEIELPESDGDFFYGKILQG